MQLHRINTRFTLEICANSVQSALNAQLAGAQRVELCANLWESGTTPSYASIKKARELLEIQLFVLVRPRGGDFVYTDLEFDLIKENIMICKELGADGIVSGVLDKDNAVDLKRTRELIELSHPLPFTFHRAFDMTPDLFKSLEEVISLGAHRILTSGGMDSAGDAVGVISKLHKHAASKIIILAGGGINKENIQSLLNTGCTEFHLTGNVLHKSVSKPNSLNLNGTPAIPERDYFETSIEKIRELIMLLNAQWFYKK